jgi:hypothetical protein
VGGADCSGVVGEDLSSLMASRVLFTTSDFILEVRPWQSVCLHSVVVERYVRLQPPQDHVTRLLASVSRKSLMVEGTVAGHRCRGSRGVPSTIWWGWPSIQQKRHSSSFCTT